MITEKERREFLRQFKERYGTDDLKLRSPAERTRIAQRKLIRKLRAQFPDGIPSEAMAFVKAALKKIAIGEDEE